MEAPIATTAKPNKSRNHRSRKPKSFLQQPTTTKKTTDETEKEKEEEEQEGELCFICTEPITIFAVSSCDHRTCHKCILRLRALYETRNCAYCKVSCAVDDVKKIYRLVTMATKIYNRQSKELYCLQRMKKNHLINMI
jgi:hypothetical protein